MTLRHRRAIWFGDQNKIDHISRILQDPILSEALELIFAIVRSESAQASGDPAETLMRRQCELNGMQKLLSGLEMVATPIEEPSEELIEAWSHFTAENPYTPSIESNA